MMQSLRRGSLFALAVSALLGCGDDGAQSAATTGGGSTGSGGIDLEAGGIKLDVQAGDGTAGGGAEQGGGCGSTLFGSEAVPPNVLIVLDRSGSMDTDIGGGTKWEIAQDAIDQVTTDFGDEVYFGLMLFPGLDQSCNDGAECSPGMVFIDPAPGTAGDITTFLGGANTCSFGTPIAENLDSLVDYVGLEDPTRNNYVLLVTDGMATCEDPVPSVTALRNEDPEIRTFVVGFGDEVDPDQLNQMAMEGGTALPGDPVYYQADDAAGLSAAFNAIAGSILSCEFVLEEVPDDPDDLFAFLDMVLVDRDPTHMSGWDYDPATNRVTFYGPACDSIQDGEVETVQIVFGCPELPPEG